MPRVCCIGSIFARSRHTRSHSSQRTEKWEFSLLCVCVCVSTETAFLSLSRSLPKQRHERRDKSKRATERERERGRDRKRSIERQEEWDAVSRVENCRMLREVFKCIFSQSFPSHFSSFIKSFHFYIFLHFLHTQVSQFSRFLQTFRATKIASTIFNNEKPRLCHEKNFLRSMISSISLNPQFESSTFRTTDCEWSKLVQPR